MFRNQYKNIVFGMSGKSDGQMLMKHDLNAKDNRQKFFSNVGLDASNTVIASLVHGNVVRAVAAADRSSVVADTDALVTNEKDVILSITAADCLPVYFYDSAGAAVGMAHAGWRGVEANIAAKTVYSLMDNFGVELEHINVLIGPHIQACHFTVREDVAERFAAYGGFVTQQGDISHIDLAGIVRQQLIAEGVLSEHITVLHACTFEEADNYFSYRRDKPEYVQAQVAYIGIL